MKLTLVLLLLSLFVAKIAADFHVIQGITPGGGQGIAACPSNYYNCKCYKNGNRAGVITDGNTGIASLDGRNFFQIKAGLCGMGKMNFYKQGDGSYWKFYVDNGDGKELGTCYTTKSTTSCSGGFFFIDRLICYSYVCNA